MFKMRREQKEAFSAASVDDFRRNVRLHLQRCFPEQCHRLGEAETANAIVRAMDRARGFGLITERDMCKYLSLMFACGEGFDGDAGVPGAKAILDQASVSPEERLEQLYEAALDHLRGPAEAEERAGEQA